MAESCEFRLDLLRRRPQEVCVETIFPRLHFISLRMLYVLSGDYAAVFDMRSTSYAVTAKEFRRNYKSLANGLAAFGDRLKQPKFD